MHESKFRNDYMRPYLHPQHAQMELSRRTLFKPSKRVRRTSHHVKRREESKRNDKP